MARWGKRWTTLPARHARLRTSAQSSAVFEPSGHSLLLAGQIKRAGLPAPCLEYPFAKHLGRRYRADLAYPSLQLLIEVDGMVHRIKARFAADLERDQVIFQLGLRKLRVSPKQVRDGRALELVKQALA